MIYRRHNATHYEDEKSIMTSICCTPPPDNYNDLTPEEMQRFGKMVNQLRKQGYDIANAQKIAYSEVLAESIPFD